MNAVYSNYVLVSLFIRMFNNEINLNFNHVFQLISLEIEASKTFHIYSFLVKWIKKKTVTQIIIHLSIFVRPSFLYKTYFYQYDLYSILIKINPLSQKKSHKMLSKSIYIIFPDTHPFVTDTLRSFFLMSQILFLVSSLIWVTGQMSSAAKDEKIIPHKKLNFSILKFSITLFC